MRKGIRWACGTLLCLGMLMASVANATDCEVNVDRVQSFTTPQSSYVVMLQGYLPTDVSEVYLNPFTPPNNAVVSVDASVTIITFSGGSLSPGTYHFGYVLHNCPETPHGQAAPGTLDEYWAPSGVTNKKSVPNVIL